MTASHPFYCSHCGSYNRRNWNTGGCRWFDNKPGRRAQGWDPPCALEEMDAADDKRRRSRCMWLAGIVAAIAISVFIWAIVTAGPVRAHDHYDPACCSNQDCRPLHKSEFKMDGGQWFLRNLQTDRECGWEPLPESMLWDNRGRVRVSPDFTVHGCFLGGFGCKPLCIYVGGGV